MTQAVPRPRRKDRPTDSEYVTFSVRMPGFIYNALTDLADQERRTTNAQLVLMLERALGVEKKP